MQQYQIEQSHDYLHMNALGYRNGSLHYLEKNTHYLEYILNQTHIYGFALMFFPPLLLLLIVVVFVHYC